MVQGELKAVVECLVFAAEKPVSVEKMMEVLDYVPQAFIQEALCRLAEEYKDSDRGLELVEVAGGFQFRTKAQYAPFMEKLKGGRRPKLSRAALETLAIIAYKQPMVRAEIEALRGVDATEVLHHLLERGLVRVVGKKEVPGRPFMYGTTRTFLEVFGLKDLSSLPSLRDWEEIKSVAQLC